MRPLILMIVNVVSYLAEQNTIGLQDPHCFFNELRIKICERIAVLFWRAPAQTKPSIEVLLLVLALIGDMRRIIDDHIKDASRKRHCHVVADNRWAMYCRYVHPDDLALGSAPKSATVYRGIKDVSWLGVRVEIKHAFQEFAIFAIPNRRNRCVGRWRFGLFDKSYQSRLLFG